MLEMVVGAACVCVGWLVGWQQGKAYGLRQPLGRRVAALRADLTRSDASVGYLPPRVRRLAVRRSQRGDGSPPKGR